MSSRVFYPSRGTESQNLSANRSERALGKEDGAQEAEHIAIGEHSERRPTQHSARAADLGTGAQSAAAILRADRSTLTKAGLVALLFNELGLNKREAKEMVEAFFELILDALEKRQQVKLSSFGSFQLRDKGQRPGRNLKTGEAILIAARRVVTFHASQKLKIRVEMGRRAST
ncbi:Integration host factor subunit alpha (IHF-alpha) (modular protein) [Candidatus Glomeribacter gigasporarum BEG34]|uniref:Integration host factor subunit alpha n=1 Tax=Candidatus Glomeribacter gigasporarum BEG34 TaxID=1070319 RepID=G2J8D1_9BURK|nr:Integration host factor subunit alpha (IHF-alpha) (modular protein) [Candidatus Glomeribacter gigasporarum BEG34]